MGHYHKHYTIPTRQGSRDIHLNASQSFAGIVLAGDNEWCGDDHLARTDTAALSCPRKACPALVWREYPGQDQGLSRMLRRTSGDKAQDMSNKNRRKYSDEVQCIAFHSLVCICLYILTYTGCQKKPILKHS